MPKARRRRRAGQFWRDAIAAWKESGQTVTTFRAARGIVEPTSFATRGWQKSGTGAEGSRSAGDHDPTPTTLMSR
jgi:hypothetical protein